MAQPRLRPDAPRPLRGRRWAVLFDWGETVMRVFPGAEGAMVDWPRVAAVPGVRGALAALAPHALLGIATNAADSDPGAIRAALARVRLDRHFERLYCYRSLGVRKPSPEYFAAVLADLALPPDRVVMVGDEWQADVAGALAAGLRAVWYDPGRSAACPDERVLVLHDMRRLPDALWPWGVVA